MIESEKIINNRYEILEKIGSGGMSVVYKGIDKKLNRTIAIKILKTEYSNDKKFIENFKEEAQAAASLSHQNIVNVYDVGEFDDNHYIIMEFIDGITLKNYIERKCFLTVKEATSIAIQIAVGLNVAHSNGIVHRDVKPQNVMITKDGKIKVMDFGIAKSPMSKTVIYNTVGSVRYMSPEQIQGEESDHRCDIYSLGIVMYEMLAGCVPFDGDTTIAIAVKHLQEEIPSLKSKRTDLPISLDKIVEKCTNKKPEKRYSHINDLIEDLKRSLVEPDVDFIEKEILKKIEIPLEMNIPNINSEEKESYLNKKIQNIKYDNDEYDEYEDEDDDEEEIDPRMEKIMTMGGVVAGIIIIIMLIILSTKFIGFGNLKNEIEKNNSEEVLLDEIEMIDVRGMTWEEAKNALNEIGLGIKSGGSEETNEYEEGQIAKQSIDPNEMVEKNTSIEVIIAIEKIEKIKIPDVTGQSKDDAEYRLKAEGFLVDYTEIFHDTVKSGKVIKTTPDVATEQQKGTVVYMTISKGPEIKMTKVPSLINVSRENAEVAIKNAKLVVGTITDDYSDTVAKGSVIGQSVLANTEVEEGVTIDLVISKGPEKVTMPNLWGNPKDRAIEKLHALGLSVEVYEEYSDETEGRVFKTDPEADAKINPGSTVKIVLSKGVEPIKKVTVPDLVGKTETEAKKMLESVGLKLGNVSKENSESIVEGYIIKQLNSGEVDVGTSVDIVISIGKVQEEVVQ